MLKCLKSMEIKKDENGEAIEPTVEELRAQLAKTEEERENYKKGLLEREAKLKELKNVKVEEEPVKQEEDQEDEPDWDEASRKFQEETLKKTQKAAEEIVTKTIESKNEKSAIQKFRDANLSMTEDEFQRVLANYNPDKFGKDSVEAVIKGLERADVLRRFDSGEVIDPAQVQKTIAQETLKDLSSNAAGAGYAGGREPEKGASAGAISIGQRMRVSKEALEKEDDSPVAEINIV